MKKTLIFLAILIFVSANDFKAFSQGSSLELGKRNLKLGNTYRESGEFDAAKEFLDKGLSGVESNRGFESQYWQAVAYEYYGFLYRDMGQQDNADANFRKALDIYSRIIKQSDGSQVAMQNVMESSGRISKMLSDGGSMAFGSSSGVINLSNSKLRNMPYDLPLNSSSLILSDNRFRDFPDGLNRYKDLEYLDISGNRLRNVSASIGDLNKLHYLDLSNNRIDDLPNDMSKLKNLRELNLSNNKLKEVPMMLCELKGLRLLNLKGNKIRHEDVMNLVRCLPSTNITFDEYIRKEEEEVGDEFDFESID
ncbi:MAG: leucine-rich repeat domain-containing protein [Candidatus Kapabacteria bacterium]|nr:leucine-rich repeat domain-containing protein [Candidatus Kapabacteria bacterium]